ncbi:MAG: CotH kinase family protein, partial [Odoribacteraceae bacterium]|nr:CotH kinase family protein [Odoribacteraceae bacterium]
LLELDSYYDEDNKFKVTMYSGGTELPVNIQSPEDEAGAAALSAIRADVQLLVDRLTNNRQFNQPDDRYRDLIDMTSTVDFLLINEIVGNQELQHPKSTYMYKEAGDAWSFGPLWDFDWAFGYSESGFVYFTEYKTTRFLFNASTNFSSDPRAGNVFFSLFFRDPVFRAAYKARWNEMKPHFATITDFIGEMGEKLSRSAAQNKTRWNKHYASINHATEIARMKTYMTTRINYLDGVINGNGW